MKPVCVSTWSDERKYFKSFISTANKYGIKPQNADPKLWPGSDWKTIEWFRKSEAQVRFVREHASEYTHFMFTDSYDIVFAAGWDEIMFKYLEYKSPIVFGAECYPWPYVERKEEFPTTPFRCRYLNAGFWMGETDAVLEFANALSMEASKRERCDQGIAVDMFLSGKYPIKLDNDCRLLHCCNMDSLNFLSFANGRIVNTETGKNPCLFHGNGNSDLSNVISWINQS